MVAPDLHQFSVSAVQRNPDKTRCHHSGKNRRVERPNSGKTATHKFPQIACLGQPVSILVGHDKATDNEEGVDQPSAMKQYWVSG
ncbi:hypothetical protein NRB_12010 [Novosphingobium sp. 11B]